MCVMAARGSSSPFHWWKVKVNARYCGEFAYKFCHRLTHCFLEASSFSKMVHPFTPHSWHSSSGLLLVVPNSSVSTNGPKVTGLESPKIACLECYDWRSTSHAVRTYRARSSCTVDLEWLSSGSHWQIPCEFHEAINNVYQSQRWPFWIPNMTN